MRQLIFDGNVVNNAERKMTTTGKAYYVFRMANNDNVRKDSNETFWITVRVWDEKLFGMMPYITKGKPLNVIGFYSNGIWTRNDGTSAIDNMVSASQISFVNSGRSNESNDGAVQQPTVNTKQVVQEAKPQGFEDITIPNPTVTVAQLVQQPVIPQVQPPVQNSVTTEDDDDLPF